MNLTGANNFSESNDYTVYTVNSNQNGQYSVIMPKNTDGQLSMLVDLNMKADFDALVSNTITKESLLEKIDKEYNKIKATNPQGILVFPMTDTNSLSNAVTTNDKQKIIDETKKIGGITSELYKNLTDSGFDKSKINQKIMIVEKNDVDNKFVEWLKVQMPNFVDGIKLPQEEEKKVEEVAPAPVADPFAVPAPETPAPVESTPVPEPAPAPVAEPVASNPFEGFDPFGAPASTPNEPEAPVPEAAPASVAEPVSEPTPVADPFAAPAPEPQPAVASTPEPIPEPQPINSVSLENTQAIPQPAPAEPTPVPEATPAPVAEPVQETSGFARKSGGFANILIILVILAVVTVASIELGKFLFNTFGA